VGSTNGDIGDLVAKNRRTLTRWNLGASGNFSVGASKWSWDAYYQRNSYDVHSQVSNTANIGNLILAIDAVRNPATGAIVCRSTLTNPSNGCVPYNVMGTGVNSPAALNYVTGVSYIDEHLTQDVFAASFHGEPFSTWAGPVSVAFGGEHRREGVSGVSTPLDLAGAFFVGDFQPTFGSYTVNEGFLETVIPLAKDASWAKELDLNGAVRATDYSTSGYVTTWKLGATYAPVSDVRFRATRSRDIRAPNLGEQFSAGQVSAGASIIDTNGTVYANSSQITKGNPQLKPEIANTTEFGVVVSPSFLPGFQASLDYYNIDISGAVQVPNAQTVVNLCGAGNQVLCSRITRANGTITVITQPENILSQKAQGLDFEASYRLPLSDISSNWNGTFSVRVLGTYVLSLRTRNTDGSVVEGSGVNGGRFGAFGSTVSTGLSAPDFVSTVFVNYDTERLSTQVSMRYVGAGSYNNAFSQCSSNCTAGDKLTINDNHIAANAIFNLSVSYKPFKGNSSSFFFAVNNILNTNPPIIGGNTVNAYYQGQANSDYYDRLGRMFQAGIRFRL
jgi:outer membrane receptor protein involved in Fe transport